jgi:hypothetical protein
MGSQKCRIVGKSQPVLIMIHPIIFTRTRSTTHWNLTKPKRPGWSLHPHAKTAGAPPPGGVAIAKVKSSCRQAVSPPREGSARNCSCGLIKRGVDRRKTLAGRGAVQWFVHTLHLQLQFQQRTGRQTYLGEHAGGMMALPALLRNEGRLWLELHVLLLAAVPKPSRPPSPPRPYAPRRTHHRGMLSEDTRTQTGRQGQRSDESRHHEG